MGQFTAQEFIAAVSRGIATTRFPVPTRWQRTSHSKQRVEVTLAASQSAHYRQSRHCAPLHPCRHQSIFTSIPTGWTPIRSLTYISVRPGRGKVPLCLHSITHVDTAPNFRPLCCARDKKKRRSGWLLTPRVIAKGGRGMTTISSGIRTWLPTGKHDSICMHMEP